VTTVNPAFIGPKGLMSRYSVQQCTSYYQDQCEKFAALGIQTIAGGPFSDRGPGEGGSRAWSTPDRIDNRGRPDAGGSLLSLHGSKNCRYNFGWRDVADESAIGWREAKEGIVATLDELKPDAVNFFAIVIHDHQFTEEGDIIWNHKEDETLVDPNVVYMWKPSHDSRLSEAALLGLDRFLKWTDAYVAKERLEYSTHEKVARLFRGGKP